ncbi:MAG: murein biosynthesis integral membrane protein MurJ [Anaerolineae bacterium]
MSKNQTSGNRMFRAAGVVALFFLLTRFFGLLKVSAISNYYGINVEADAFYLALRLPDLLFGIVAGGALGSAFIPTFSGYLAKDDEQAGWDLFSAVLNLILLLMVVLAGLAAIFTESIIYQLYIDISKPDWEETLRLAVPMTRVMLLSIVIFGASGLFMAALNAKQHFFAPAVAGVLYNLGIILGTVFFAPNIMGAAWGAVIGAALHALVQIPALLQNGVRYRPIFQTGDGGVRQVLTLMGPRIVGLSFSYLNPFIVPTLARSMLTGTVAGLNNANQIMLVPYSLLGQAVGVVSFPTMAALAAEGNHTEMRRILTSALRSILFLGLPMTIGLILLRRPTVMLLLERGEFTSADTDFVSGLLFFYALAILPLAGLEVIARAFYSLQDTWTPVIAALVQLPVMIGLSILFAFQLFPAAGLDPAGGIALGFSLSNWIEVIVLVFLLRNKLNGIGAADLIDGAWRMGVAAAVMIPAVVFTLRFIPFESPLILIPAGGAVGVLVYFGVSQLLAIRELVRFTQPLLRRLGR